jgi:hypothetical protein
LIDEKCQRLIKLWVVVRKPEGKRPPLISRCRCKNNIVNDIKNVVGICVLDSFGWGYGPLACFSENGNEI